MLPSITKAEQRAIEASKLPSLTINITEIRESVFQFLKLFGREGVFDEYTVHDYDHIHEMLEMLEWIIPDTTKEKLTPADWMMLVLSIYLHDICLVITKKNIMAGIKRL